MKTDIYNPFQLHNAISTLVKDSISPSPLRRSLFLIMFALTWFVFSEVAHGQLSPAPDGGYPKGNTAEGDDALFHLNTSQSFHNAAVGFQALLSNTIGGGNTANGASALGNNTTGF